MPDVSIIILNWNAKQHLLNCLHSLVSTADGYSQEIIVIDNGSSDGSPDAIACQFPEVTLIRNAENLGFAKANNIGIRKSSGRYVCLINSDVIVLKDCIGNLVEFMDQHPNIGIAGPRILNPDRTLQPSCGHFTTIWNQLCQTIGLNKLFPKSAFFSEPFMKYWAHDTVRKVDVIYGMFWIIRREAVDEVGLLDEDFFFYGEDLDWCKRFNKSGWDVMFYPGAEAIHIGAASVSKAPIKYYLELQKADLQYWRKHHGRIGQAIYAAIILLRQVLRIIFGAVQYVICPSQRRTISFKLKRSMACIRCILRV